MSPEQPSSKIGKSVGENLRAARVAQHYTQSQLAAPDFSVSYISAIERGQIHPSLRALEILASRLGLTSTQLLPNRAQQDDRLTSTTGPGERDEDEVALALLEAQLCIVQDKADEALSLLEKLATKRLKHQDQLQQRYLLGWTNYKLGRYQESEYTLAEATQMAKDTNAQYLHLRILHVLALTYAAMRNYAQALSAHQRCLNLIEENEIDDPFFTLKVYIYIGQHYSRLENVDLALDVFHKALTLAVGLTTTGNIQAVYTNLCQQYALQKDYDLATLYAYKSNQLHNQDMMKRLRGELYHYLGHAIMQGDQEKARAFIDEALQKPGITQDHLTLASITTRNAQWYVARQEFEEALRCAQKAQELACPFGDTIIAAEALILLGRIEYTLHHYDDGSKHFVSGLDMLERLGSHEELADESVRYAQLLEEIGREHEAFTHFRRAFQSKQKLGK